MSGVKDALGNEIVKPYPLTEGKLDSLYRQNLDDSLPDVEIGSMSYSPSRVLYNVDPIAYRVDFSNWLSWEVREDRLVYVDREYYRKEDWDDYLEELEWYQEEE